MMKLTIAKTCRFKTTNCNLLPALLLTPLYGEKRITAHTMLAKLPRWYVEQSGWTGFRLALKFLNLHLGMEVHMANGTRTAKGKRG